MIVAHPTPVRVLIAEGGDHYKILEQIYHLLHGSCDLTFYVIDNKRYDYRELFPSIGKTKVLYSGMRGIPFFAGLLFHGARYDVINISTGPDGSHFTELFRIVCFYLCCLLYGHKIVFTIRNTYPYLPSSPGLFSSLRSRSIRHLKRFTFETKTMRDAFVEATGIDRALLGVSYDRYPDLRPAAGQYAAASRETKIRIGLLGSINEQRRDYESICEALATLSEAERARLVFVTLGACTGGTRHPVMERLSQLVAVDCRDGLLSEQEFNERGIGCHVLMAPLSQKKAYGVFNGSGSFGDVVYLRKKMILPRFADPRREFADLCLYYDGVEELANILRAPGLLATNVALTLFEPYTRSSVLRQLCADLQLQSFVQIEENVQ